jgi:alpha-galactosidase
MAKVSAKHPDWVLEVYGKDTTSLQVVLKREELILLYIL